MIYIKHFFKGFLESTEWCFNPKTILEFICALTFHFIVLFLFVFSSMNAMIIIWTINIMNMLFGYISDRYFPDKTWPDVVGFIISVILLSITCILLFI